MTTQLLCPACDAPVKTVYGLCGVCGKHHDTANIRFPKKSSLGRALTINWMKGQRIVDAGLVLARTPVELRSEVHLNSPGEYQIYEQVPKFLHNLRGCREVHITSLKAKHLPPARGRYRTASKWDLPSPNKSDGKRIFVAYADGFRSPTITSVEMMISSQVANLGTALKFDATVSAQGVQIQLPALSRERSTSIEYIIRPPHDPPVEIEILQGRSAGEHLARLESEWAQGSGSEIELNSPQSASSLTDDMPDDLAAYFRDRPVSDMTIRCEISPDSPATILVEVGYSDNLRAAICLQVRDLESGRSTTTDPIFLTAVRGRIISTALPTALISRKALHTLQELADAGLDVSELASRLNQEIEDVEGTLEAAVDELGAGSLEDAVALASVDKPPVRQQKPSSSRGRKVNVTVTAVCDLPHDVEVEGTETVSFSYDGTSYEIDLCPMHAKEMRATFRQYAEHARRVSGGAARRRRRRRSGSGRERSSEIRAWAKQHGHKVSERGRIPASIIEEYKSR